MSEERRACGHTTSHTYREPKSAIHEPVGAHGPPRLRNRGQLYNTTNVEGSLPRRRRTGHRTGNYPVIIRKHLVRSQEWGTWTDPSTGAY